MLTKDYPVNKRPKIAVVGSSNMDMVIRGDRLPVRGETVLGDEFVMAPGGKGANQAVTIAKLGGDVSFIAKLGNDYLGERLLQSLKDAGVDTRFISRDLNTPSGVALILVDSHGDNMIEVAPGSNSRLSKEDVLEARSAIASSDVVLTQLEIPMETVRCVIELVRTYSVQVILNPAPARELNEGILSGVDILTPNRTELETLADMSVDDESSMRSAAQYLIGKGVKNVVVTLGSKGSFIVNREGSKLIPTKHVKVVDSTAAGDAFNGGLAFALAKGMNLEDAVSFANHVGALTVTKIGAQPSLPTWKEVREFMD